jgi:hypothetical protein
VDIERAVVAGFGFVVLLIPLVALYALAWPYLVLRLRPLRADEEPDSQVGLKCALFFILSLGILMLLTGLNILVFDAITAEWFAKAVDRLTAFGPPERDSCALMLSGFVFAFFHMILIMGYTNNHKHPEVRRVWIGWRFAIHSLIILAATTMIIFVIFQDSLKEIDLQRPLSVLIVWGPSWLIHLAMLKSARGMGTPPKVVRHRRDEDEGDEGEKPVRPVQPQRPTQPTSSGQQQPQKQPGPQRSQPVPAARPVPQQRPAPGQVQPRKKPAEDDDE